MGISNLWIILAGKMWKNWCPKELTLQTSPKSAASQQHGTQTPKNVLSKCLYSNWIDYNPNSFLKIIFFLFFFEFLQGFQQSSRESSRLSSNSSVLEDFSSRINFKSRRMRITWPKKKKMRICKLNEWINIIFNTYRLSYIYIYIEI